MADPLEDPNSLPLQVFTTAASLLELVDKRVVISLRDGRTIFGALRSFDNFGNLVLQSTIERIYLENKYAEIARGVWIVRGENVAMVGELDLDKELVSEANLLEWTKIEFAEAEAELEKQKAEFNTQFEAVRRPSLAAGLDPSRIGGNPHMY